METNTMRIKSITSLVNSTSTFCVKYLHVLNIVQCLIYFESFPPRKKTLLPVSTGRHRWVIYTTEMNGKNTMWEVDGSMVPAEWYSIQHFKRFDLIDHISLNPLYLGSSGTAGCTAWRTTLPPHTRQSPRSSWPRSTRSTWVPHHSSTCPTQPHARRFTSGFRPKPELHELLQIVCKLWSPSVNKIFIETFVVSFFLFKEKKKARHFILTPFCRIFKSGFIFQQTNKTLLKSIWFVWILVEKEIGEIFFGFNPTYLQICMQLICTKNVKLEIYKIILHRLTYINEAITNWI